MIVNFVARACFIVIESDYPEYDDYPQAQIPSRFPAQQSQEIRLVKKYEDCVQ